MPIAIPPYAVAYCYADLTDYSAFFSFFPSIRSRLGAIFILSLTLFPYVYLICKNAFTNNSMSILESAANLGADRITLFFKFALPISRPAIVASIALVVMETLADFGTVDFFSINTLTLAIFNVWLGMGNASGAAQISLVILIFVFTLLYFEKSARNRREYHIIDRNNILIQRNILKGYKSFIAFTICFIPLLIGFIIPSIILFYYSLLTFDISFDISFYKLIINSFSLSLIASLITVIAAIVIASGQRLYGNKFIIFTRISLLGYAFPGAVLALGIIIPLALIDNYIDKFFISYFNISTGLILSGSIFALLFAYLIRFIAIGYGAIESGYTSINKNIDMASISLGAGKIFTIKKIHIPLLKSSILIASIIVFVDTMKELPATLILRPFNFDTLATNVYQLASDELLEQSSLSALTIVLVGIVPLIFLTKKISDNKYFS